MPTRSVVFSVYLLMGALAGLAGAILTARTTSALPQAGLGYELDAIAAVVIGGTSLTGGIGSVVYTLIAARRRRDLERPRSHGGLILLPADHQGRDHRRRRPGGPLPQSESVKDPRFCAAMKSHDHREEPEYGIDHHPPRLGSARPEPASPRLPSAAPPPPTSRASRPSSRASIRSSTFCGPTQPIAIRSSRMAPSRSPCWTAGWTR